MLMLIMVREADILDKEQIRKNCGNMGTQGDFGREQGPPLQGYQPPKSSNIENW